MKPRPSLAALATSFVFVLFLFALTPDLQAASATWLGSGPDGAWTNTANWNATPVPGSTSQTTNGETASFNTASVPITSVVVDSNRNLRNISFLTNTDASYTFTGGPLFLSSAGTIQIAASVVASNATMAFNLPIVLQPASTNTAGTYIFLNNAANASSNSLQFSGNISGGTTSAGITLTLGGTNTTGNNVVSGNISDGGAAGGVALVKSNTAGVWTLSGSNTYTGGTTMNGGVLRVGSSNALGTGGVALNGGTLASDSAAARTITNAVTMGGNITLGQTAGGTGDLTLSNVDLGAATRTFTANNSSTIAGAVSNGGLTKAGPGTLTLSGSNSYAGGTTLNAGVLRVGSDNALGGGGLLIASNTTFASADASARAVTNAVTIGANFTLGETTGGTGALTLSNVNAGTTSRTITVNNSSTIAGSITNTAGFTKAGAGTLTLSGSNSHAGGVLLSAGQLNLNNASAVGTGTLTVSNSGSTTIDNTSASAVTLAGNAGTTWTGGASNTLTFEGTRDLNLGAGGLLVTGTGNRNLNINAGTLKVEGALTGSASAGAGIIMNGPGILDLAVTSNTYSGTFIRIAGGVIRLSSSNAFFTSANTQVRGGILELTAASGSLTGNLASGVGNYDLAAGGGFSAFDADLFVNFTNSLTWGGTGWGGDLLVLSTTNAAGTIDFRSSFALGGTNRTVLVNNGSKDVDAILSGTISGGSGLNALIKDGLGTLRMSGTNTYTVGTAINAGVLEATTLGDGGVASSIGQSSSAADRLVINGGALRYVGSGDSTDRNFTIGDNNATIQASGTGTLTMSGTASFSTADAARTLTLGGTNTSNNTMSGTLTNNGSGALAVTKTGPGRWVLSGNNSYTGNTTVSGGSLIINGDQSAATGVLSVSSGATLGGSGTIGGTTTIGSGATHSPGTSPGVQTFTNGINYLAGSTFVWELTANSETGRGTTFDGVNVTGGTLDINSGVASSLVFNAAGSSVLWSDSFWDENKSWLVFSNASLPTLASGNIFDTTLVGLDSASVVFSTARPVSTFTWSETDNNVYLNYVVPEPSTYALLALAAAGFTGYLLRRRKP